MVDMFDSQRKSTEQSGTNITNIVKNIGIPGNRTYNDICQQYQRVDILTSWLSYHVQTGDTALHDHPWLCPDNESCCTLNFSPFCPELDQPDIKNSPKSVQIGKLPLRVLSRVLPLTIPDRNQSQSPHQSHLTQPWILVEPCMMPILGYLTVLP